MARHIKGELGWKQKAKENVILRTKIFGIFRNVYVKMGHSKSAANFSSYVTAETAKGYEIRVEQEKAKATEFLLRRTLTIQ